MVEGAALDPEAPAARAGKSVAAFRTISEVADELDVAQHVLRFWESKFPQVRPLKRAGGRRYYRPEDIDLLRHIRKLLYDEGYTIKGAQRLLRGKRPRMPHRGPGEPAIEPSRGPAGMPSGPQAGPAMGGAGAAPQPPAPAPRPPNAIELRRSCRRVRDELRELKAMLAAVLEANRTS
jgi:DNA-binding transcriptional MerR regulator